MSGCRQPLNLADCMKQLFSTIDDTNHKAVIHEKRETQKFHIHPSFLPGKSAAHESETKTEIGGLARKRKQISVWGYS